MAMFEKGGYYPPQGHKKRIARYNENKLLFKGFHHDVFERNQRFPKSDVYLSINLAGLICKKSADFLFGEKPVISAGREDNSPEQEAIDRLVRDNDLPMKLQKSATGNAFRGDSFFKIRWGQKFNGKLDEKVDPYRVFIDVQNPAYVFPEASEGDATLIEKYHIAFPTVVAGSGDQNWILNVESHEPNKIVYRKFNMTPIVAKGIEVVEWKIGDEITSAYREVETEIPVPLVVHIPNYALDDEWQGLDDISEHKSLFDELNRRLSAIASILDKHADPAIAIPAGLLQEDEDGNPIFNVGRNKIFELMGKDDITPQYIVWNGQLSSAYEEMREIKQMILLNAEIPEVALGAGDSGTSGSSGLAIKFRMNSLLAKINRKRQFYDKGLKEIFFLAQLVEHTMLGSKVGYELIPEVNIHFKDGLPQDDAELANIMNVRSGGKPTISQKTALMRLDNLTEEQADAELQRMQDEADAELQKQADMFATQASMQVDSPLDGNQDDVTKAKDDGNKKDTGTDGGN